MKIAPRNNISPANVILIVGPTAIGKTSLSVRLAKKIGGEIISADSMQIYKDMKILSQSPTAAQKKGIRHHLAGELPPGREYSAAMFVKKAARAIKGILKNGKVPIVVGGSGLYNRALVDGLFPAPEASAGFREKMKKYALKYGPAGLHRRLMRIDPSSAESIHPNDIRRVIRALEIYELTGRTMTQLKSLTRGIKDMYRVRIFGLTAERAEIYARIEKRCDNMFDNGAAAEVKKLRKKKISKTAAAVLGFKEISGYLDGAYDLPAAKEMLKMNTRRFAKRQLTWFRADGRIEWFDVSRVSEIGVVRDIVGRLAG